jgi:hypothetical protein
VNDLEDGIYDDTGGDGRQLDKPLPAIETMATQQGME